MAWALFLVLEVSGVWWVIVVAKGRLGFLGFISSLRRKEELGLLFQLWEVSKNSQ